MRKAKVILLYLLFIFVAIQFFRPSKNKSKQDFPDDIARLYTVPGDVQILFKNACYDCHSNNTNYPWYVNLQPVGWWLDKHIKDGKKDLNFNEYGTYSAKKQRNKLKSIKEQIADGEMPLKSYTLMHSEARLTSSQKGTITKWIDSMLHQNSLRGSGLSRRSSQY